MAVLVAAGWGLLGIVAAPAEAQPYVLIDLGTFGGAEAVPAGINEKGEVTGYARDEMGNARAFVWHEGVLRSILPDYVGGGNDINDAGHICGWYGGPFFWDKRHLVDIGHPPSAAWAMNNNDEVVGWTDEEGHLTTTAYLWKDGEFQKLGTLGGAQSITARALPATQPKNTACTRRPPGVLAKKTRFCTFA
ncbi:MAG: hypothetical protein C4547_07545, partial [Phycisphaerales bacterium]